MFSYNFSIQKLIEQNRNPFVIVGNMITFCLALCKPLQSLKDEMMAFIIGSIEKEKWTFQIMSMEKLLNDKYAVNLPNIYIETLYAAQVHPLANRFGGNSFLGERGSIKGFLIPTKEQAVEATGVNDHFVIYADQDTIDQNGEEIKKTIDYYKFSGLRYQLRSLDDIIINPDKLLFE